MDRSLRIITSMLLAIGCSELNAADWSRQIELGAVFLSGNTEEETVKFRGDLSRESEQVRNHLKLNFLRSTSEEDLTAQKLYTSLKTDFKMDGDRFAFARVSYEDDRFNGFDYQTDLVLGYGQTILQSYSSMKLDLEVGPGYRYSQKDHGETEGEGIVRLSADYSWDVSENARFEQKLSSELGSDANITRASTALKTQINGSLSMKLSFEMKNNSKPPKGTDKTDLESAVTLVYEF